MNQRITNAFGNEPLKYGGRCYCPHGTLFRVLIWGAGFELVNNRLFGAQISHIFNNILSLPSTHHALSESHTLIFSLQRVSGVIELSCLMTFVEYNVEACNLQKTKKFACLREVCSNIPLH